MKRETKTEKTLGEKEEKNILNKFQRLKGRMGIFCCILQKGPEGTMITLRDARRKRRELSFAPYSGSLREFLLQLQQLSQIWALIYTKKRKFLTKTISMQLPQTPL